MSTLKVNGLKNLSDTAIVDLTNGVGVTTGKVGVGTASPAVSVDARSRTDALALPVGTTAQRPTPLSGYTRWNSTTSSAEIYNGTEWVEIVTDYIPSGSTAFG
jgi:hypothetical protein